MKTIMKTIKKKILLKYIMGKHSEVKFKCEQCDSKTGVCSNRKFHLKMYRRHYYIFRKSQLDVPEITVEKKKVVISLD